MSLLTKIGTAIKQKICKHSFGTPQIIYDSSEYKPGELIHPQSGKKIPVLKREFRVVRTCQVCGKVHEEKGYNSLPMPEENLTEAEKTDIINARKRQLENEGKKTSRFKGSLKFLN